MPVPKQLIAEIERLWNEADNAPDRQAVSRIDNSALGVTNLKIHVQLANPDWPGTLLIRIFDRTRKLNPPEVPK